MHQLVFSVPEEYLSAWYPFAPTRKPSDLLWGGLTLEQHWRSQIQLLQIPHDSALHINPLWIPSQRAARWIGQLTPGNGWKSNDHLLAELPELGQTTKWSELPEDADILLQPTDLFRRCGEAIADNRDVIARNMGAEIRTDWPVHVTFIHDPNQVLAGKGVTALACTFNTENGPIIIGENATIEEGARLRGPLVIGANSVVKMGCRINGPSAIGEDCRMGGEISNVVVHSYTNKAHDGFLGNSVLGSWCNLGAGTNSSNLKSNYSSVRLWSEKEKRMVDSALQFCGLLMGDHAKSSINTSFNTGTTVGPAAQIFGSGFPPKHIPAFSWGGGDDWSTYEFERFVETARNVMSRRGVQLEPTAIDDLRALHASLHG